MHTKEIYLDNAATTKVDKKVAQKVMEIMTDNFGNASSQHRFGIKAKKALDEARQKIAEFLGAEPSEIIFTSGGTESNNIAIRGLVKAHPEKKHLITSKIEHSSVLATFQDLESQGYKVDYISVDEEGIIKIDELKNKITQDTLLVSIMHVNNEVGTIQPIEEIAEICKEKNVFFHSDMVQSFKKLDINLSKMNIHLASFSGHKIHAPKGIGILYKRKDTKISPIITGGGHEKGLRSGTVNVPGAVGISEAISIETNREEIKQIRDWLMQEILKIPGTKLNGSKEKRIYNNINVSFYGLEGESLMLALDEEGIAVSTGSACSSGKLKVSHVLKAMNVDDMYIQGSIRITIDKLAKEEAEYALEKIKKVVKKLSEISPFKYQNEN